MEIKTKQDNFNLLKLGCFGNTLRTWYSLKDLLDSNYNGKVTIRYSGKAGGSICFYDVDVSDVFDILNTKNICNNYDHRLFVFNESAPDNNLLIQGELMLNENGKYYLFYSTDKGKMRDCLKNGKSAYGLEAKFIIKHYFSDNSYSDIMELLESYPNCVIEFSTYSHKLGSCSGRNTVIWEVRTY